MGLGDMETEMQKMLNSLEDELREEKKPEKKPDVDINDMLRSVQVLIHKEKKKAFREKKEQEEKQALRTKKVQQVLFNKQQNRRRHILIVDDDTRVLKMIKEVLKDDYDTGVATNGEIALKFLEKHATDMILLDYMMPGKNGKEVLEEIRQYPQYTNVPVVFLTGMSESSKVKECLALRPTGYMLKPVKRSELLKRVKEILG